MVGDCTLIHSVKAHENQGKPCPLSQERAGFGRQALGQSDRQAATGGSYGEALGDGDEPGSADGGTSAPGAHAGMIAQCAKVLESPPAALMR
jgi:hypothetical protein